MTRGPSPAGLLGRPAVIVVLSIALAACTAAPGASPSAAPGTVATSPAAAPSEPGTVEPSLAAVPSESSASPDVTVRTLGQGSTETFQLLVSEILERGDHGNCVKTAEGERTIREESLKAYLASATGVERLIGPHVWLGSLEGAARSLGSVEVVVPGNRNSRQAYIVLRVPAGTDIDVPAGSLAAIEVSRLDAPAGVSVPPGAELWLFTGDLIASTVCG